MAKGRYKISEGYSLPLSLLFSCLIFFSMSACSDPEISEMLPSSAAGDHSGKETPVDPSAMEWKLPIKVPEGEFLKVFGWLEDNEIVYASNVNGGSNLYSYSLETGKSELKLASQGPIANVLINPQRTRLLVHTSPSSYEAIVTIYDREGNVLANQSFPSAELHTEWNLYKENEAIIVAFSEDWSYQAYLMDAEGRMVSEIEVPDPFVKWAGEEKIAYLNWNENAPSFFAPLVIQDIGGKAEVKIDHSIYHLAAFNELLLTISTNEENLEEAIFTFYTPGLNPIETFTVPHLSRFSDWFVPYFVYNKPKQEFTIFEPVRGGEADSYTDGFTLASYKIGSGKREILLEDSDNQPLMPSPNGEAFLYGYRLERIIDTQSKKTLNIVNE